MKRCWLVVWLRVARRKTANKFVCSKADDKPGQKLAKPVYHISLNFAIEDKARLSDGIMAEIAREYMRRMGIVNTQYIVCRHTDTAHPHLHIVANRVDNTGNTISDSNDSRRSTDICRQLTQEYGLHIANSKDNVRRDRLRGKDRIKYRIHDAVKAALAVCRSWSELDKTLDRQGIQIRFRYDMVRGRIIGILFTADGCSFSGSKIDRSLSFFALDRRLGSRMLGADERRIPADSEQYRQKFTELAQSGRLVAPRVGDKNSCQASTDSRRAATTYSKGGNGHTFGDNRGSISNAGNATDTVNSGDVNGAVNAADSIGNIIQITVATFIKLAVQPHQARISSGGGGSSDRGSWNDKDKDKNEYRPRRRR